MLANTNIIQSRRKNSTESAIEKEPSHESIYRVRISSGKVSENMKIIDLKNRTIDSGKIADYGFRESDSGLVLEKHLHSYSFTVRCILKDNSLECHLIDDDFNEEYELVDLNQITGYAALVKDEYDKTIEDILSSCTEKTETQKERIIHYVYDRYQDKEEHLWIKFPEDSIIRKQENRKWYCLFMKVEAGKLGLEEKEEYDVMDLRGTEGRIKSIDNIRFFPGYHMNKKHWYTIILNETMTDEEIKTLIEESYNLAK